MMGERYNVSTENPFVLLGEDEMARDGFQAVKRRRNNTDQDQNSEQCVNGINKCVNGTSEEKLNFICEELCLIREGQDRISRGMSNFQQGFRYMNEKLCEVIEVTNTQSCVLRTLAYKSIDLEARSRRNNLIFWGILENPGENCFQIIRDFIQHNLDLDSDRMYLARAHRLGPRKIGIRDPRRPIIVNFRDFIDTDTIMNKAFMLKNTPFSISYDLPKEINEARKRLWSELRTIKANKPFVKFQILYPAKLLVEGKVVRDEFPDWGKVMQGSRLVDFVHIDSHFSSDQPNTVAMEQPTANSVNMREQFMRDHILTSDTQLSCLKCICYVSVLTSAIIYYILYYTMLGFLALLEYEINYLSKLSIYTITVSFLLKHNLPNVGGVRALTIETILALPTVSVPPQ